MIFEIDLAVLEHNFCFLKNGVDEISAVVKADAYGFGAKIVTQTLYDLGCKNFCVGNVFEGLDIRTFLPNFVEIVVFNGFFEKFASLYQENALTPSIISLEQLSLVRLHSIPFWLFVDTGLNRTGVSIEQLEAINLDQYTGCRGIMTHFLHTKYGETCPEQERKIKYLKEKYHKWPFSILKSSGFSFGHYFHDRARFGHALYFNTSTKLSTNNIGQVFSEIIKIDYVKKGDYVGYDHGFQAAQDMKIGLINCGYSYGLDKQHPFVFVNEHKCRVLGKISMDFVSIDLSEVSDVYVGDVCNVFGNFSDIAQEIECSLGYLTAKLNPTKIEKKYKKKLLC